MGKLHLTVRFSCANTPNMLHMYAMSLLPKMHYVRPLSVNQLESLSDIPLACILPRAHTPHCAPPYGTDLPVEVPVPTPPHAYMDIRFSQAETVYHDELGKEFDSFPPSKGAELVRTRYDRLRTVAGRIRTAAVHMANQGERSQALLSWRGPRATFLFIILSH
ncbi:hypothetical protein MLD38_021690 [Melastoma candidum]|uniref:Uncharacterized protein n=1 Tax=Melastoma candidum TaxID=119954 RepID=A0ACB9QGU1_9MYRT|nr:hypothetical protein MLD38_021690 [Melastoma candidum]